MYQRMSATDLDAFMLTTQDPTEFKAAAVERRRRHRQTSRVVRWGRRHGR